MFYRFNRSRALQCGIRAMSVLSGPELGELPICMRMVLSYLRYLLCFSCFVVVVLTYWFGFDVDVRWQVELVGMMLGSQRP